MQKHSATAPDTPEKEGIESSFPVKMHAMPLQNQKKIIPILIGREPFFNNSGVPVNTETPLLYPVDYLFSNQFMEDLGRIYQLRKYFPSFDDDVCQSSIPSSDDSGL